MVRHNGKDMEVFEACKEAIPEMIGHAVHGVEEYFGKNVEMVGEYQRVFKDDRLDIPTIMFLDYADDTRQIDLKCSLPVANPPRHWPSASLAVCYWRGIQPMHT